MSVRVDIPNMVIPAPQPAVQTLSLWRAANHKVGLNRRRNKLKQLYDPASRCTCGSCCASCCHVFTSTWPGSGRTASNSSSAIAGSCSALRESSPTPRPCACGRRAGHTTRSGQSPNGSFAYTSLKEKLCIYYAACYSFNASHCRLL